MSQKLDELFLTRARQRGLLSDSQVDALWHEIRERDAVEPDLGAHELAVEKGWVGVEAALALLDARPEDTVEDLAARLGNEDDDDARVLEPEEGARVPDTERFHAVHDVEISPEPDDEGFAEVPRLVEPLPPTYAVEDAPSADSHLEMELPPPADQSGDSLFEDSDSRPEIEAFDNEDARPALLERTPSGRYVEGFGRQQELTPQASDVSDTHLGGMDTALGDLNIDDLVDDEEVVMAADEPSSAETFTGEEAVAELRPTRPLESDARDTRSDTATYPRDPGRTATDTKTDTVDKSDLARMAPAPFELRASKGATDDFAAFGDDDPVVPAEIDESDEVSAHLVDSAVGEVMQQADDAYFGPPADLSVTPPELMEDSIAPPRPMEESTLFDSESLRGEQDLQEHEEPEDFVATAPPRGDMGEPASGIEDDSDVDVSVTLPGEFPTDASTEFDENSVTMEEIADDSGVSEVTTGSRTAFATGEIARPGLRNRTDSKLGYESESGAGSDVITGKEMTLADLRQQMGLGQGVKIGSPEGGALARLKKTSKKKRYSVVREIARGGMGKVIEVEDNDLRRSVALKVLRKEMLDRKDLVERFLEEAQITGQLEHPNIVPVHEIGVDGRGNLYFTMKLVEGEELSSIIKRLKKKDPSAIRAYPLARLVDVFIKVCEGVAFAHSRGVIHRDLKPANIMVGRFGEVQIMDWGVAKIVGRKEDTADREVRSDRQDDDAARTMVGSILGTPSYMSPEQARGEVNSMGPEADIFSLGVILYELLAMQTPWTAQTSAQVLDQVKNHDPESPTKRAPDRRIPPELDQLAMKCLVKAPHKRIATAEELIDNLRSWQAGGTLAAVEYSIGQLIGKWIVRHKVMVITSLLVLGALIAGGIGVAQYFQQQKVQQSDELVAGARNKYREAQTAFDTGDYSRAEDLGLDVSRSASSALALNPDSEEAQTLQVDANVLIATVKTTLREQADTAAEARERERRLSELRDALASANDKLTTAKDRERNGEDLATLDEAYRASRSGFEAVGAIRVDGADDEKAEALKAINEIDNWLDDFEQRKNTAEDLKKLRALVTSADTALKAAQALDASKYSEATHNLNQTITLADQAIAINVSGNAGDKLRADALTIKAQAALRFAIRAMDTNRYDVAELMLNTAAGTGRLAPEIDDTRTILNKKVEEQSRFNRLLSGARNAVAEEAWGLAQSEILAALKEAETSEYATDKDRAELTRMLQLAKLEELHLTDTRATTSEQLTEVYNGYVEMLPTLTDPDFKSRALAYRDDARRRLGLALYNEGTEAEDNRVKGELLERALEYITDKAVIAEIRADLTTIKLSIATESVSEQLVLLPLGSFIVGSNREGDSNPQRTVDHQSFVFMDRYLVTNEQFKAFIDDGGYTKEKLWHADARPYLSLFKDSTGQPGPAAWAEGGYDTSLAKHPVAGVSWYEADAFARWSGRRLPGADEWEIAAGAPRQGGLAETRDYPFGAREDGPVSGVSEPREVGTTEWDHSPLGVRDLGNNVAEWTGDIRDNHAVVKGAEPGLRPELFFRYARRAKNSVAQLLDRSYGRGFRCANDFKLSEDEGSDD
ncbi:MAG: protein kinase [Planctomycetes bacterium]|nr:protein kinase [Planctomycetota bacterium]